MESPKEQATLSSIHALAPASSAMHESNDCGAGRVGRKGQLGLLLGAILSGRISPTIA